jgi:hypothetical protein
VGPGRWGGHGLVVNPQEAPQLYGTWPESMVQPGTTLYSYAERAMWRLPYPSVTTLSYATDFANYHLTNVTRADGSRDRVMGSTGHLRLVPLAGRQPDGDEFGYNPAHASEGRPAFPHGYMDVFVGPAPVPVWGMSILIGCVG